MKGSISEKRKFFDKFVTSWIDFCFWRKLRCTKVKMLKFYRCFQCNLCEKLFHNFCPELSQNSAMVSEFVFIRPRFAISIFFFKSIQFCLTSFFLDAKASLAGVKIPKFDAKIFLFCSGYINNRRCCQQMCLFNPCDSLWFLLHTAHEKL